jgi:hypothetical protein
MHSPVVTAVQKMATILWGMAVPVIVSMEDVEKTKTLLNPV